MICGKNGKKDRDFTPKIVPQPYHNADDFFTYCSVCRFTERLDFTGIQRMDLRRMAPLKVIRIPPGVLSEADQL